MKIRMKVADWNTDPQGNMEIMLNIEDFFEMLDGVKPRILADYIAKRMKPEEHYEARLVNTITEEGGAL